MGRVVLFAPSRGSLREFCQGWSDAELFSGVAVSLADRHVPDFGHAGFSGGAFDVEGYYILSGFLVGVERVLIG